MPPAQNPSFVMIGWPKTVIRSNTQYYCSNVQPRVGVAAVVDGGEGGGGCGRGRGGGVGVGGGGQGGREGGGRGAVIFD